MSCDLQYPVVHSYFDGELTVAQISEFKHHLRHCLDCIDELAALNAVRDVADQWHAVAEAAFQTLFTARVRLVATPLVLHECGNAAARKPYRADVAALRQELQQFGDLLEPTLEEVQQAWVDFALDA